MVDETEESKENRGKNGLTNEKKIVIPAGVIPKIHNIVATMDVGCQLDLKDIACRSRGTEYNPKRFVGAVMRIREPKTTALIFSQGKIVVVGAKTEKSIYFASRLFIRILNKLGYAAKWRPAHFKFRNFVATTDLRFPVKLEALAFEREDFCSYEPEVFPGLIYRMDSPHVVLLVFVSGKIVFCGAKTREQIYRAFEKIFPILVEYQK